MSFNLGEWWKQLTCDLCKEYAPPLDLNLPPNYYDGRLPDDFWDPPPDPPSEQPGLPFDVPDYYPSIEFLDDGFILKFNGPLP